MTVNIPPPVGEPSESLEEKLARLRAANPLPQTPPASADKILDEEAEGEGGEFDFAKWMFGGLIDSIDEHLPNVPSFINGKTIVFGGLALIIILIVLGVVFALSHGEAAVAVVAAPTLPTVSAPAFEPSPGPIVVESVTPPKSSWDLSFSVPSTRLEWKPGWWLTWFILIVLNLFFRAEATRRGDPWDWVNVTVMLLVSIAVMTAAKGVMVVVADQCQYWLVDACPMGQLSLPMIDTGAMILWVIVWLVVFFSSLSAAYTGRLDYSPWAVGTFSVSLLAKLLLAHPAVQLLATFGMVLGLVIYGAEIGGLRWPTSGKITPGGWFAFGFGLLIMATVTPILATAFGYLAGGVSQLPWLAIALYQGRLLWGLLTAWGLATAFTYMLTPSIAPQLERLGTGSVVVGDAEKVDTATMLLMVVCFVFAIGWMPIIAGWLH